MSSERWKDLRVSDDRTHHVDALGRRAYDRRLQRVHSFHDPGLAPAVDGTSAFHILADGADAYSGRFDLTFGFYEGLAAVRDASGWHHILPNGKPGYSNRWDWSGNFQNGRCVVQARGGTFHHIDRDGVARTGPWVYAGDFREGAAAVRLTSGLCRHILRHGSFLHDREYLDLEAFHKGFALARDERGWFHVDRNGVAGYSHRYAHLEPFYNGLAYGRKGDGTRVRLDSAGAEMVLGNVGQAEARR